MGALGLAVTPQACRVTEHPPRMLHPGTPHAVDHEPVLEPRGTESLHGCQLVSIAKKVLPSVSHACSASRRCGPISQGSSAFIAPGRPASKSNLVLRSRPYGVEIRNRNWLRPE